MTIGSMIHELAELTPAALHQRLIDAEAKFAAFEQRLVGLEQLIEDAKPVLQKIVAAIPPFAIPIEDMAVINAIIARMPDPPATPIVAVSPAQVEAPSAS